MLGARYRNALGWLAVFGALAWFQGEGLLACLRQASKPHLVNDDALQQIFPFFEYTGESAFAGDYIARYYLDCYPLGYFGLYASTAKLGIDPAALSRALPFPLWMISVVCVGFAANRLGGKLAAFAAMALAFGSNAFMERMGGGLPRSFGFPIIAGTLLALAYGRVWWCAACVVLGALFYPVAAVISGLSLAGMVLTSDVVGSEASAWSWLRRLATLAGTALLAAVLLVPAVISSSHYGGVVRPWETREFPEAGSGGRYDRDSRPPFPDFFAALPEPIDGALLSARPFSDVGQRWREKQRARRTAEGYRQLKYALLVLALLGGAGLFVRNAAARRIALLGVASGVGHAVSREVVPLAYLPERYIAYTAPVLAILAASAAVAGLFPRPFDRKLRWLKLCVLGGYVAVLLTLLFGVVTPTVGLPVNLRDGRRLYEAISRLPPDAVVAGWPSGPLDQVPYAARRRVLLNNEVHQAFHKGYIEEMRRRMRALIDAYLATSIEPILKLRDEYGVTHLLVRRAHFDGKTPHYFKPFDRFISQSERAARGKSFELPKHFRKAKIVSDDGHLLLDLSRVAPRKGQRSDGEP